MCSRRGVNASPVGQGMMYERSLALSVEFRGLGREGRTAGFSGA